MVSFDRPSATAISLAKDSHTEDSKNKNQAKSIVTNVKHIKTVADRNCAGYEDFKEVKYKRKTQLKDLKDKKEGKNDREKTSLMRTSVA